MMSKKSKREIIIEEGSCSIKHAYDKDIVGKAIRRGKLLTEIICLRCGETDILANALEKAVKKGEVDKSKLNFFQRKMLNIAKKKLDNTYGEDDKSK